MISHDHQFIFVHIPKAAGTSVMSAFGQAHPPRESAATHFAPDSPDKFEPLPPHLRAIDYLTHGHATAEQFQTYFKFSFVRNPWARLVSEYRYRVYGRHWDFKTFLFNHFPRAAWSDKYCHVLPQYDFLYDKRGHRLVDFVGRMETLQKDFCHACEHIGIDPPALPRKNTSKTILGRRHDIGGCDTLKALLTKLSPKVRRNNFADYRDYYDDESRE